MNIRLFAALPIPDEIADRLVSLQRGLPGAKWRPRENFHLTLRFFGEMDNAQADDLDGELASIVAAPFDLVLKGAGAFGGADPHAVWIGAQANEALEDLARRCEKAARRAGLKPETRKFTPHVTLAYLRGSPLDKVEGFRRRHALFEAEPFRVTHFSLYSSWPKRAGANAYQVEIDYPLG